jgi:hypothetical protein
MKKVNLLLGILYINPLFLSVIVVFILKMGYNNNTSSDRFLHLFFWIWVCLYIALLIINIVSLVIDYKGNNTELLFKKMKRIKLGLIPFWVINFLCSIFITIFCGFVLPMGIIFLVPFLVPILIFPSYIVLCFTSVFSVIYLKSLYKNGILKIEPFIIHSILQFMFVTDIIDTLYIIEKWGKLNIARQELNN